jgi:hypothetical protein
MHKSQHRIARCRKARQHKPPKVHDSSISESKGVEIHGMPDKKMFQSLPLKMIHDLQENSNKQMNSGKTQLKEAKNMSYSVPRNKFYIFLFKNEKLSDDQDREITYKYLSCNI